jgi:cytochrome c553
MKKLALLTIVAIALAPAAFAEDKKLEGEALCAKCHLKQAEKCRAAVQVKTADGKTETYLTEPNAKAKELHSEICEDRKAATVEGDVSEKDGVKTIKLTSFTVK